MLVSFDEAAIEITSGVPAECEHISDESGRWLRMSFCSRCGTTVSHTAQLRPGVRSIAGGTFDDPQWFAVQRHIWVQSKLPWVHIPEGVAVFQQGFVVTPTA